MSSLQTIVEPKQTLLARQPGRGTTLSKQNETPKPQDIRVQLQYLKDDPIYKTQKPLQITPNFLDHERRTNVRLAPGDWETLNDVRGKEEQFSLDQNGFKYVKAPTTFTEWASQPRIGQKYLPELEALLKKEVDGCDEIMFYDARLRFANDGGHRVEGLSYNPFARQVHTDNTEKSVLAKIRCLTDMKADYVLSGRCRIINIWRPIKHRVYDCGLAIADGGALKHGDIIECDRHRSDTGEYWDTMGVAQYRPGFNWHYMSQQDESEVLLFKNYDSATDVPATTCLHTAFDVPSEYVPAGSPTRESIEVRALIMTYPTHRPKPARGLRMPHPLATSLEQSRLKRMDLDHSLTDRVRTDIDEGSEVKDAILLLRKREIRKLQQVQGQLEAQREELSGRLTSATMQIGIQSDHITTLQGQNKTLQDQLETQSRKLNDEIRSLSLELASSREKLVSTSNCHPEDVTDAPQQLVHISTESTERSDEDVNQTASSGGRLLQSAVDEAVQLARKQDAALIGQLRKEIDRLKQMHTGGNRCLQSASC